MKVLFDHCVPKPLRRYLPGHEIKTAYQMGREALKNGKRLDACEVQFDVLLTVDQNLPHQQTIQGRQIAIVVIVANNNTLATLAPLVPRLLALLSNVEPGHVYKVSI